MNTVRADDDETQPGDDRAAEESAIVLAAQRDLRAFEPIYQRYYRPIFGYCYRRLQDREAAADATSETFTKALAGIHGYRAGSVSGWLFTIARNVVIDAVRRRRPHANLDDVWFVHDPRPLPDQRAITSDQQRLLFAAMRELSPDQRHIVDLRLAGLTGPEIAEVLGMSVSAVKSSQFRAYSRLRKLLAEEDIFGDHS